MKFETIKKNWELFISRFNAVASDVFQLKSNVFLYLISETRTKESLIEMAETTRPFIAKEIWDLLEQFMSFMKNLPDLEGENYRAVYSNMTAAGLVKRLLTKRPIVFLNSTDENILRENPLSLRSGKDKWNNVARNLEYVQAGWPYLQEYISYDEMTLSALVNMSTPTYFVSDGSLRNAFEEPRSPYILQGILCGLIGARLEKNGFMEHRFVFPRDKNNLTFDDVHLADGFWINNVYSKAFPEGKIPTLDNIKNNPDLYRDIYVNGINVVYLKKRLSLSVIPFIEEAANRGFEKTQKIIASVPSIGAGVWRGIVDTKTILNLIVTTVLEYLDNNFDIEKLSYLEAMFLPVVDNDLYSKYSPQKQIKSVRANATSIEVKFDGKVLMIFNQRRFVAQTLPEQFRSSLVVAGYAWDGNSYPGNEYWIGSFGSFDPQAILCSLLGQFQNPEVNVEMADSERIKYY